MSTKACDTVPIIKLWKVLKEIQINSIVIKALKKFYKGSRIKIKREHIITIHIGITKGLRQGSCNSTTLFKMYAENTLKTWKIKCKGGVKMNGKELTTFTLKKCSLIKIENYSS